MFADLILIVVEEVPVIVNLASESVPLDSINSTLRTGSVPAATAQRIAVPFSTRLAFALEVVNDSSMPVCVVSALAAAM